MWRITRNAKFVNDQCPENCYADKENLCGWLCSFVAKIQHCYNNNIPNIVITGCNFTNCNVSLCSKFDVNEEALIDMDKVLKGLTAEQLFDDR